ncbi:MAG: hypothetical protein IPL40_02445 [Proteobacteria bacterium]|nr:hypothetical protein [Pseudomonadota bacterium]
MSAAASTVERGWGAIEAEWQQSLATTPAEAVEHPAPPSLPRTLPVDLELPPLSDPLADGMPPLPPALTTVVVADAPDWSEEPTPGPPFFATTTARLAALTEAEHERVDRAVGDAPSEASPIPSPAARGDAMAGARARAGASVLAQTAALSPSVQAAAPWALGVPAASRRRSASARGWGWLIASLALLLLALVGAWWILRRAPTG